MADEKRDEAPWSDVALSKKLAAVVPGRKWRESDRAHMSPYVTFQADTVRNISNDKTVS